MRFPFIRNLAEPARVAVTGAGIVTALGLGWKENAAGFQSGRTTFQAVDLFDVSRQRVKMAAQVSLPENLPPNRLHPRQIPRLDRADHLLLHAAYEGLRQARWDPDPRIPIVLGTTSGGMSQGEAYYRQAIDPTHSQRGQPSRVMSYQAHRQATHLAEAFGFDGPHCVIANACASSANAIGCAWEFVHSGQYDRVLTGGYDALSQMVFAGFDSLHALSPTRCRPFDKDRDGLALGEGAAVLCLERFDLAEQRHAVILGEIVGYGAATDGHHLTQPHPEGEAAFLAMSRAAKSAGLKPEQIDYLNAHGTGTPLNDQAEALAINRWAGTHAGALRVSSTKASIGHLLGAAGAVEATACLMALREQWIPPTATTQEADPACAFELIRRPTAANLHYALSNSFGFGGANASLILKRYK